MTAFDCLVAVFTCAILASLADGWVSGVFTAAGLWFVARLGWLTWRGVP